MYDGWNVIAKTSGTNSRQHSYVWGLDMSGGFQGAGGVGGLLIFHTHSGTTTTSSHSPACDGNGNVMAILGKVGSGSWTVTADYAYDAFGHQARWKGTYHAANPFRFRTKYCDDESGHLYYGYRFYSPETGRWLSRDPIGERGGLNLYGFVGNDGVNRWDSLGHVAVEEDLPDPRMIIPEFVQGLRPQDLGVHTYGGMVRCRCKDAKITCLVWAAAKIYLNWNLNPVDENGDPEPWGLTYGREQLHIKAINSYVRSDIVVPLRKVGDLPATPDRAKQLQDDFDALMQFAIAHGGSHDPNPEGTRNDPRPVEGRPYSPLAHSVQVPAKPIEAPDAIDWREMIRRGQQRLLEAVEHLSESL